MEAFMKQIVMLLSVAIALLPLAGQELSAPQFNGKSELLLPGNYREWIFLSSGLGMTYGPAAAGNRDRVPMFDNVFVNPTAYRSFLATGTWPSGTMFVLEMRGSVSKGSINNDGHYQNDLIAIESEVKDTTRFPGAGWAFFGFGTSTSAKMIPRTEACYSCHSEKGAVDNTFVQFYPTLLAVAKAKGTLTPAYVHDSSAGH
jgi:hypothetical protein